MTYRIPHIDEMEKLALYCEKKNVDLPGKGYVLIAVDDNGNIKGITGIKMEHFIEPLAADNALVANRLYEMMDDFVKNNNFGSVRCLCEEKYVDMYNRKGFQVIGTNKTLMEKSYG